MHGLRWVVVAAALTVLMSRCGLNTLWAFGRSDTLGLVALDGVDRHRSHPRSDSCPIRQIDDRRLAPAGAACDHASVTRSLRLEREELSHHKPTPVARVGANFVSRYGLHPDGPHPLQAEYFSSLQSSAGNRAVAGLVEQQRRSGGHSSAPVVQRKLLFDGAWYGPGKGSAGELAKKRLPGSDQRLPGWTRAEFESPGPFVLNETMTAWVADPTLTYYRVNKGGKTTGKTASSVSHPDPAADVGLGERGEQRVGPKQPRGKMVTTVTILKNNDKGHTSLECIMERGDGKKPKPMKIDLISSGYRLLYGAEQPRTAGTEVVEVMLVEPVPIESVYKAMADVARERGQYSMVNNRCGHFAEAMSEKLQEVAADLLRQQAPLRALGSLGTAEGFPD